MEQIRVKEEGVRILARRDVLTEEDWFKLLEARQTLLEPYLRKMTLKSLGDLKIVRDHLHQCEKILRKGGLYQTTVPSSRWEMGVPPVKGEECFSLDTRGIFPNDEMFHEGHFNWKPIWSPEGKPPSTGSVTRFWGLTRNNIWIKVEVLITYHPVMHHGVADTDLNDYTEQKPGVELVSIDESTPLEICKFCEVTPRWLWQRLGDVVREWEKQRRQLFSEAQELADIVRSEETIMRIVESNK